MFGYISIGEDKLTLTRFTRNINIIISNRFHIGLAHTSKSHSFFPKQNIPFSGLNVTQISNN